MSKEKDDQNEMPELLQAQLASMTGLQRGYCEYRAKGMPMNLAAKKAGSQASDESLRHIGYNIEQMPGTKEYMLWLKKEQSKTSLIDGDELIVKLREVYIASMKEDKFSDANKAIELMGRMIGYFGGSTDIVNQKKTDKEEINLKGFKEESGTEDNETDTRIIQLQQMMKDINK